MPFPVLKGTQRLVFATFIPGIPSDIPTLSLPMLALLGLALAGIALFLLRRF